MGCLCDWVPLLHSMYLWAYGVSKEGARDVTRIGISICAILCLLSCARTVKPIQTVTRAEALRLACEDGSRRACYEQGMMYLKTDLVSDRRARRALGRSCELQYGQGCFELARLVGSEMASESARRRSTRLYKRACQFGWSNGCHMLATQAFIRSKTRNEMVKATDALARLCGDEHPIACMDYLRGRLALGLPTSDILLSRLRSVCRHPVQVSDVELGDCQRLANEGCAESGESCAGVPAVEPILQYSACPIRDHDWVVSVVHVAMLECRAGFAGTLTLRFDPNGSQSTPRVTQKVTQCVDERVEGIKILPLTTARDCYLKLQF